MPSRHLLLALGWLALLPAFLRAPASYRTAETGIGPGDGAACLTGNLVGGTPFEGCAAITTVPAGPRDPARPRH